MIQHDQFQQLLDTLVKRSGVGQEVLGEVMARTSLRTPEETSRVEISAGNPTARRPVDQREIPQGTVSKAVKALMDEGLLEDGEKLLRNPEGRTLSPLRLGRLYATAGVKIAQAGERPRHVTTALFGLDSTRVLGTAHDAADSWDQAADLIHRHVTSLKSACDRDRASHGLEPLRMLGVGIELGAPVYDGQIMPLSRDPDRQPVPLAEKLQCLFQADPGLGDPSRLSSRTTSTPWRYWPSTRSTTPIQISWWSASSTRESAAAWSWTADCAGEPTGGPWR